MAAKSTTAEHLQHAKREYANRSSLISISDLSTESIRTILDDATKFLDKNYVTSNSQLLRGRMVFLWFREPSTRTKFNFEIATNKLGGYPICIDPDQQTSMEKGESFEDTVRTFVAKGTLWGGDCIVMRDGMKGAARAAAEISAHFSDTEKLPYMSVINAGDGGRQHPTQALIDMFTVKQMFGKVKGLRWLFAGDLSRARTINTTVKLLDNAAFKPAMVNFVSHPLLRMDEDVLRLITYPWRAVDSLDRMLLENTDILYMTRWQKERYKGEEHKYKDAFEATRITAERAGMLRGRILHPMPRTDEIELSVDAQHDKVGYWQQSVNGVAVAMAVLKHVMVDGRE